MGGYCFPSPPRGAAPEYTHSMLNYSPVIKKHRKLFHDLVTTIYKTQHNISLINHIVCNVRINNMQFSIFL